MTLSLMMAPLIGTGVIVTARVAAIATEGLAAKRSPVRIVSDPFFARRCYFLKEVMSGGSVEIVFHMQGKSSKRTTARVMPAIHRNHSTAQIRSPAGSREDHYVCNFLNAGGSAQR